MKILRTLALAGLALTVAQAFAQATPPGKAGGKNGENPAGWDQGTKKGWEGDQPPGPGNGKRKVDAEAKRKKDEAAVQKKHAERDRQKTRPDGAEGKKADKTSKGVAGGAKSEAAADIDKSVDKRKQ